MRVCTQVLKNPSVPFQEGKSVELSMLTSRGVKPYGPPVDVWAAGVLAYELVCGRCGSCAGRVLGVRCSLRLAQQMLQAPVSRLAGSEAMLPSRHMMASGAAAVGKHVPRG